MSMSVALDRLQILRLSLTMCATSSINTRYSSDNLQQSKLLRTLSDFFLITTRISWRPG
uniref:Uncharacterized protein n=1 Tax=Lotus japonicus TaxID=34305 RepID=I3S5S2_LOTJA|nr:unknown [Lotus japonicus]